MNSDGGGSIPPYIHGRCVKLTPFYARGMVYLIDFLLARAYQCLLFF